MNVYYERHKAVDAPYCVGLLHSSLINSMIFQCRDGHKLHEVSHQQPLSFN